MATSNCSRGSPKELPKDCFNRKSLVTAHQIVRHATEQEQQRNGKQKLGVGSAESGKSSPSISLSSQPLSSLKEIFLRQLELDKRHHGRVLFGTLYVRPCKMAASVIMSILSDKSGKAVSFSILNLPSSLSGQEIEARFPPGQKAAIKEPFLVGKDGKVLIRVENPADIVLVDDANKEILKIDSGSISEVLEGVLKELDDIRTEGNKLFADQKWKEAIAQYRKCIARGSSILEEGEENEKINQRLLLAYSNRSEVWLQLSDFKNALDDANKALEFDPNHLKSLSRRDRAWQGFGKVKVPVEDSNASDKTLASKIKPTDVTEPAPPLSSKGNTTTNPNPLSSGVSTGNDKNSKPVSPPPIPESASVESKKKPAASSVASSPSPTPESASVDSKKKPAASSVASSPSPTPESAFVDSKEKPAASSVTSSPLSTPESASVDSKKKPAASSVTSSPSPTPESASVDSKKKLAASFVIISPPPTPEIASVDSKKKPAASSVTIPPPPTPESASVDSKRKPSASSVTKTKTTDTESKNLVVAVGTSATSTSKAKATTERKSVSPPPSKASKVKRNLDAESKNLVIATSTNKVKATIETKSASPPPPKASKMKHIVDTESKNLVVAVDTTSTSKVKATNERKSVSPPPPKASKVKHIEKRDNVSAASVTPTKGKKLWSAIQPSSNVDQHRANADPPGTAKGTVATFSNRDKTAAAVVDSGRQSSDSDSENNDSPTSDSSKVEKRSDADDGIQDYTVIERKPTNANGAWGDSSLPPGFPDSSLTLRSSTDPHKEMAASGDAAIDTELPSFAPWLDSIRSSADVILSQGNWAEAVKLYNRVTGFAVPQRNRDEVIQTLYLAYSHRSEAWIWTGDFEKSLRDADCAIKIVDNYPKIVVGYEGKHLLNEVRRGRAFHGLGEYEKACLVFYEALKKFPNDKSINDLLSKSRVAFGQSQKGIYDLDGWFVNRCCGPPPLCSDYVGPVEIRRVLGKGRGLFVTKDVAAGDLLLVSNPLLVVRRQTSMEDEDYSHLTTKWRRSRPGADPVGLHDFVMRLARLRTEKEIYQLYSLTGGNPDDEIEVPDMGLFSPGAQDVKPAQGFDSLKISDEEPQRLQRLARIAMLNSMEGGLNPLDGNNRHDEKDEAVFVGGWALPSFVNHSCVPNCHMIDIGDAMFVRASRNIQQGEELTRAYFDVYQIGMDRYKLCAEWSFVCNCERCVLEKSLTDQRILPAHEYRALLERAREQSLKRQQFTGREKSLSVLLPNPQPALLQLRKFADWCDGLLDQAEGLRNKEKAWIGASHLEAYISRFQGSRDRNQFILALENILEYMTNTAILAIGYTTGSALEKAAVLLAQVEDMYGRGSQTYRRIETRVLDLYHTTFGIVSKEVLFTMSRLIISKC